MYYLLTKTTHRFCTDYLILKYIADSYKYLKFVHSFKEMDQKMNKQIFLSRNL